MTALAWAYLVAMALPMDEMMQRLEQGIVTAGNALVGRLLKGCLNREIPILVETRARELVREEGSVIGLLGEVIQAASAERRPLDCGVSVGGRV